MFLELHVGNIEGDPRIFAYETSMVSPEIYEMPAAGQSLLHQLPALVVCFYNMWYTLSHLLDIFTLQLSIPNLLYGIQGNLMVLLFWQLSLLLLVLS